jgi:hypothetical protein
MIVIFGLLFILITLIPIGFAYLVYRWLTKKGYKKSGVVILTAVTIWRVYSSYTAFYPTDSFYKDKFEFMTGIDFPITGEILRKEATYPDFHGDYSATALFKTDKDDFNKILEAIKNDKKFQLNTIPFKFNLANFDTKIKETDFTKRYIKHSEKNDLTFTISLNKKDNLIEIQWDIN